MPRRNLTPATVIAAAADVADRVGLDDLTLAEVAAAVGVRTPSLYGHVRDRTAVLDGVRELALDELADRVALAIAGRAGSEALGGLAQAQRDYAREHPGRWSALLRPFSPSALPSPGAVRLRTLAFAVLHGYAIADGELVHVTRLLDAAVNGFVDLERTGVMRNDDLDPEISWERILTALDTTLGTWPPTPEEPPE